MEIALILVGYLVLLLAIVGLRKEIHCMGERLTTALNGIEEEIGVLASNEAVEDADAEAAKAKIVELEAKIAELEARETISEEDLVRIEGLKEQLATIKAGAQAVLEGKGKKKK